MRDLISIFLVMALGIEAFAQKKAGSELTARSRPPIFGLATAKPEGNNVSLVIKVPAIVAKSKTVRLLPKDPRYRDGQRTTQVTYFVAEMQTIRVAAEFLTLADQDSETQYVTTTVRYLNGKKVDKKTLLSRLRQPTHVVVMRDGPDPYYLAVVKENTLVVTPGYFLRARLRELSSTSRRTSATDRSSQQGRESGATALLGQLNSRLQKILPSSWLVEVDAGQRAVTIRSKKRIPVFANSIGIGPRQEESFVAIRFNVVPHVTMAEFVKLSRENTNRRTERREFERRFLAQVPAGQVTKGGFKLYPAGRRPLGLDPDTYRPRNEEQKDLIDEYRLLWKRTGPKPAPSHHFQSLSFQAQIRSGWRNSYDAAGKKVALSPIETYWTITDRQLADEYVRLLRDVQRIILPY